MKRASKIVNLFLALVFAHFLNAQKSFSDSVLQIKEIDISRKQAPRMELTPRTVELISSADLVKDACCNLSESFENSATVDVNYSDAVSGAKEIKMLGLDGVYAQNMIENIPAMRGLGSTFGMAYTPGPWMSSIQINKGVGSVVNGYESIAGQINTELVKPNKAKLLFVNLFINQDARTEVNLYATSKLKNPKWSTGTFLHGLQNSVKMDFNKDGFMDNPLVKQGNFLHRWMYQNPGKFMFMTAANFTVENRTGGQLNFNFSNPVQGSWGLKLNTIRGDWFAKTGFTFSPQSNLGIQYKYSYHQQNGFTGSKMYDAKEHFGYLNIIYQTSLLKEEDILKLGTSLQTNYIAERLDSLAYKRLEIVPGIFGEATFNFKKKLIFIAGCRLDHHNLYGTFLSPRVNLKWNILYSLSLRMSAGKGYRVPVVFAENYGFLASNRTIVLERNIRPEIAWNYGVSLTYKFYLDFREGWITADFYRTDFLNQLVTDIDKARTLQFYNLQGKSYSNSFQVEASYEIARNLDLKISYKYDDVQTTFSGIKKRVAFKPPHKGLLSLSYKTNDKHWRFDTHLTWYGKSRVVDYIQNPAIDYKTPSSRNLFLWNAQVTYLLKKPWEFYLGCENIANQTQKNPILQSANPSSNQFDASMIWGPIRGAMAFVGVRFKLQGKE